MRASAAVLALVLSAPPFASACGEDPPDGTGGADAAPPAADAEPGTPDAGPPQPGQWVPLVTGTWSLAASDEGYVCASRTLEHDMYVGAIRPINPTGTHHTTVSIGAPTGPDDPGSPCGVGFGTFYASGVGTPELVLPPGVALVARAGQQVHVNLHLFNSTEGPLSGVSGVEVQVVEPGTVQHEASIGLHGPTGISIPSNNQPHSLVGEDALSPGRTIIALFPHMHQLGTHFTAEVVRGGEVTTLWDQPYQFESQEFALVGPFVTAAGDLLRTSCTWVNDTGATVGWGDSSTAEMCFSILMTY